ncbi:MAG: elongation factor G [Eubacteriaceae bacterium]|nr:elongation factor G [Eubacteriaceae bacterium]
MKTYQTKDIRNIAIFGHGGSGKTSLLEALAFNAKAIDRMGRVEDKNTISDFDPEENKRGISISSAMAAIEAGGKKINIIDVPGYFDFIGEWYGALQVADCAIIVEDALSGVEVGTEKAWELIREKNIPALVVLNKMDRENVNFQKALEQTEAYMGSKVVPFQFPVGEGLDFKGLKGIVSEKEYEYAGGKRSEKSVSIAEYQEYRDKLIEYAAESSEEMMEKYFEGEELSMEEIFAGLKVTFAQGNVVPLFVASATKNIGVDLLLDFIVRYCPSPLEAKKMKTVEGEEVAYDSKLPFSAQIFKTIADPYVGKLSLFKVVTGSLSGTMELLNSTQDKKEKVNHLYTMFGKKQLDIDEIVAGDIGAFAKLTDSITGDTLCDAKQKVEYENIDFPKPVISMAVSPKSKGDEDKLSTGLQRLREEDPTITIERNAETKQTLINGLGEVHVDVVSCKLKTKFGVDVELNEPIIPFRETIKKKATAEGKHKKQSGGRGQFGVVFVDFEPTHDLDVDMEFVDKVVGGAVPRNFIPAVEKGLRDCVLEGVLAGYPVVGLRCTLFDGKFHPVDSDEMSFKMAASLAYREGMPKANPVLLEPIYEIKIIVPEEYMGDIMGDLNKKRGRIMGMEPIQGGKQIINAEAPLKEMFRYATELRSMTQARGEFSMQFVRYEEMPATIAEKVIAEAKERKEG